MARNAIQIVVRENTCFATGATASILRSIEREILAHEDTAIFERWRFGRELLHLRKGKLLPRGLLNDVVNEIKCSRSEVQARMKLAQKYPTKEQLSNTVRQYKTWRDIKQHGLTDKPRPQNATRTNPIFARMHAALAKVKRVTPDDYESLSKIKAEVERLLGKSHPTKILRVS